MKSTEGDHPENWFTGREQISMLYQAGVIWQDIFAQNLYPLMKCLANSAIQIHLKLQINKNTELIITLIY